MNNMLMVHNTIRNERNKKDCFIENKWVMMSFKAGVLHLLMHMLNLDGIDNVVTPVNNT